jgi:hypothetical protein
MNESARQSVAFGARFLDCATRCLSEEPERGKRRRTRAALVGNNGETEMANLEEIEALFFALIGGSPGAEGVLLNQGLAVGSTAVLRHLHAHFLSTLPHRLFDLIDEPRDRLRLVKFYNDLLGGVGARAEPARRAGAGTSIQQMLDRVSRIL